MKVHKNLASLPSFKNAVVTIGSYDGVHAGHQAIIQRINELASNIDGESVLITFHPHPRLVLRGHSASLKLLNTINEKIQLLKQFGIQHLVIVPFTKSFSQQTPQAYIEDFLVKRFQPKRIVIGYDHRFGNNRAGDINLLKAYEATSGFEVFEIKKQEVDTIVVSSTKIRKALLEGEVRQASEWLGQPFLITGEVVHGQHLGTQLGYPTANIHIQDQYKLIPPVGIYAVRIHHQKSLYDGMLYIGNRPTLDGVEQSIEVNIFDFNENIYGQQLQIDFVQRIRDDIKFEGLEGLKLQLAKDKADCLKVLRGMEKK